MSLVRIWIVYRPKLYREIFQQCLKHIDSVEVVKDAICCYSPTHKDDHENIHQVDVIILSIDQTGQPELKYLPKPIPKAKLIAFCPSGEYGMRCLPGEEDWEEIRPFSLMRLLEEVTGS